VKSVEDLRKASLHNALLSLLGVLIVLASLGYSAYQLHRLENTLSDKQRQVKELTEKIGSLTNTQSSLLDFLGSVTGQENISILDPGVSWQKVKTQIIQMPAGKRKDAVLAGILFAWKDIPFTMGSNNPGSGFDSPRFLQHVLEKAGVSIPTTPGERLSDTMMKTFEKTGQPLPGDLAFFKGQVGSFGFILASPGDDKMAPVGIGTLQKTAPLQIISLSSVNAPHFPLIGYFRVKYPDE
jgi:hypothetical protein